MEMHQIRYFLAASGTLNFTRAAEQCHVSQPALTNAIKKLEGELGAPLFHRDGKRLRLSEFGQTMRPHLDQILQRTDVAQNAAENFRLLNKVPVRLGVLPTIGPVRFARALAAFQASYPRGRGRGARGQAGRAGAPAGGGGARSRGPELARALA